MMHTLDWMRGQSREACPNDMVFSCFPGKNITNGARISAVGGCSDALYVILTTPSSKLHVGQHVEKESCQPSRAKAAKLRMNPARIRISHDTVTTKSLPRQSLPKPARAGQGR